jgi:hypothetical protein
LAHPTRAQAAPQRRLPRSSVAGPPRLACCLAEAAARVCGIADAITLDLAGRQVRLARAIAQILRDAAVRRAGSSSSQRDLSLVLSRAIESGSLIALQRSEIRALLELLESGQVTSSAETAELLARARDAVARS